MEEEEWRDMDDDEADATREVKEEMIEIDEDIDSGTRAS